MKKAIFYLNYSNADQADKAQKQYDYAVNYCVENGIEIVRVFDEISTKPPLERYYFDKAVRVAKEMENLRYFLVMDFSHITDNFEEFKAVRTELESYGVFIYPVLDHNCTTEEFFENMNSKKEKLGDNIKNVPHERIG